MLGEVLLDRVGIEANNSNGKDELEDAQDEIGEVGLA